mmetsp:Transcript_14566/g.16731  ORF Transcript_14566/g.16731 Transcript_14566/m.16731 type:complete len:283 (+) Transcript_14566:3-851(+)
MEREVLDEYFNGIKYSSFLRQLGYYGFRKGTKSNQDRKYWHDHFQKGKRELLLRIERQKGYKFESEATSAPKIKPAKSSKSVVKALPIEKPSDREQQLLQKIEEMSQTIRKLQQHNYYLTDLVRTQKLSDIENRGWQTVNPLMDCNDQQPTRSNEVIPSRQNSYYSSAYPPQYMEHRHLENNFYKENTQIFFKEETWQTSPTNGSPSPNTQQNFSGYVSTNEMPLHPENIVICNSYHLENHISNQGLYRQENIQNGQNPRYFTRDMRQFKVEPSMLPRSYNL